MGMGYECVFCLCACRSIHCNLGIPADVDTSFVKNLHYKTTEKIKALIIKHSEIKTQRQEYKEPCINISEIIRRV